MKQFNRSTFVDYFLIALSCLILTSCKVDDTGYAPSPAVATPVTSLPVATVITAPSGSVKTSNTSLTISGTCESGATVNITGGATLSIPCVSSSFSTTVSKSTPATYTFNVTQTNSTGSSPAVTVTWNFNNVAPAAVTITTPASNPYTSASKTLNLSGSCLTGSTVNISGSYVASATCSGSAYSFSGITQAVDGSYPFTLNQTDIYSNTSVNTNFTWIINSTVPPTPTITSPAVNPYVSNSTNLVLSGGCQTGLTVVLSGVLASDVVTPSGSLSQVCAGSAYSYTITKPDGTYNLSVLQTNGTTNSASTTTQWIKDTAPPTTSITGKPPTPNTVGVSTFTFTSSKSPATFQCSLDAAAYSTCTSPISYSTLFNGSHNFKVRSIDQATNVDPAPPSYTWTQDASKTIALYHFDASNPMLDSSFNSGASSNTLTNNGSTSLAAGKFSEARTMTSVNRYAFANDTSSQRMATSNLTLEAQIKLAALPAGYAPIVSKIDGTNGFASFEYGLENISGSYYIYFQGSTDGASFTEVTSGSLTTAERNALTTGFNHVAVTWNLGTVKFYLNGVSKGSAVIGTPGSTVLATSPSQLLIANDQTDTLNGSIDEVRISKIVRWPSAFTPPTAPYTAD